MIKKTSELNLAAVASNGTRLNGLSNNTSSAKQASKQECAIIVKEVLDYAYNDKEDDDDNDICKLIPPNPNPPLTNGQFFLLH